MKPGKVRATAICLIQHAGRLLVTQYHDDIKQNTYYRPLGGAIEFGEYGAETIKRELMEEIQAPVENIQYAGIRENIFTSNGQKGHQIMLVYTGDLADPRFFDQPVILAHEDDGQEFKVVWIPVEEFRQGQAIIYPDGILDLLPALHPKSH
jgi:8-oxo-dGTP pyrophosphatase MutT (NUDIX family)